MNKGFGGLNSPVWPEVATPVGRKCGWCEEAIVEGDKGLIMDAMLEEGATTLPYHKECFARSIFGSVGHQEKKCHCFGGNTEDPEGMTRREAAKAACALWEATYGRADVAN